MHVKKAQLIKCYLRNANKNSPKQLFIYLIYVVLFGNVLFNLLSNMYSNKGKKMKKSRSSRLAWRELKWKSTVQNVTEIKRQRRFK